MTDTLTLTHPALAHWRARDANKHLTSERLQSAIDAGYDWIAEHAPDASPFVKTSIAILFVQFTYENDPGDRLLLRNCIDLYMEMAHATP